MKSKPMPPYGPRYLFSLVLQHRRRLMIANLTALAATLASVPVPLLMPARVFDDNGELPARLRAEVCDGDHVVFMSNGGFDDLPARLARALPGTAA